jgi:hypothetical protein
MKELDQFYPILIKTMLEKLPEQEHKAFIEGVESIMSRFDYLNLTGKIGSHASTVSQEAMDEIPKQGTRRPPRRS